MMKDARVRIFNIKRLLVSVALGVLLLSSYVFGLFLLDLSGSFLDLSGDTSPASFMLTILEWPGPLRDPTCITKETEKDTETRSVN